MKPQAVAKKTSNDVEPSVTFRLITTDQFIAMTRKRLVVIVYFQFFVFCCVCMEWTWSIEVGLLRLLAGFMK